MKTKAPFYILIIIILIWIFAVLPKDKVEKHGNYFKINNKDISLTVVETEEDREKGLSGMKALPDDTAMLFVFDKPDKYGFWMKDMEFPIDIIWLDSDYKIVHFEKNLSPDTYPNIFYPPTDSLYVIETKSGFIEENHISVGNILNLVKN